MTRKVLKYNNFKPITKFLKKFNLKLINMPCINNFSLNWFKKNISKTKNIFFLEDHNINGGISDLLTSFITNNKILNNAVFTKFGPNEFPACGTPGEVLNITNLMKRVFL